MMVCWSSSLACWVVYALWNVLRLPDGTIACFLVLLLASSVTCGCRVRRHILARLSCRRTRHAGARKHCCCAYHYCRCTPSDVQYQPLPALTSFCPQAERARASRAYHLGHVHLIAGRPAEALTMFERAESRASSTSQPALAQRATAFK